MELILRAKKSRMRQSLTRDHYWYDDVQKKMLHGHGGSLVFKYDPKQKRSVPHIEDNEQWVFANDFDKIAQWVKQNDFTILDEVRKHYITIDITASEFMGVSMNLYKHGILFDYDPNEMKKELRHGQTQS